MLAANYVCLNVAEIVRTRVTVCMLVFVSGGTLWPPCASVADLTLMNSMFVWEQTVFFQHAVDSGVRKSRYLLFQALVQFKALHLLELVWTDADTNLCY